MAEIRVPKSHSEKLDERALKIQAEYQRLLAQGRGAWQSKKALVKKYKVSMNTVYNALERAEKLNTTTSSEG
jgi:hypothetical protein